MRLREVSSRWADMYLSIRTGACPGSTSRRKCSNISCAASDIGGYFAAPRPGTLSGSVVSDMVTSEPIRTFSEAEGRCWYTKALTESA